MFNQIVSSFQYFQARAYSYTGTLYPNDSVCFMLRFRCHAADATFWTHGMLCFFIPAMKWVHHCLYVCLYVCTSMHHCNTVLVSTTPPGPTVLNAGI